jgi:hypothetical protein
MEKKYLIGAGLVVLGVFAYSMYGKKDESGQTEDQGGSGGGGGGGFLGGAFVNPISGNTSTPSTPVSPSVGGIKPTAVTNPVVAAGLGSGKPVAASTSPTPSGVTGGGITGVGSGSSPSSSTGYGATTSVGSGSGVIAGAGSTMTGSSGTVFKMADGSDCSPKTPIYLNDLVRSWNRP